jgi:hypothetical protein
VGSKEMEEREGLLGVEEAMEDAEEEDVVGSA